MKRTAYRASLFALYQLSIAAGILLLPVALMTRRFGIHLPAGRIIDTLGEAYEATQARAST